MMANKKKTVGNEQEYAKAKDEAEGRLAAFLAQHGQSLGAVAPTSRQARQGGRPGRRAPPSIGGDPELVRRYWALYERVAITRGAHRAAQDEAHRSDK
jgi:hypothetical protein